MSRYFKVLKSLYKLRNRVDSIEEIEKYIKERVSYYKLHYDTTTWCRDIDMCAGVEKCNPSNCKYNGRLHECKNFELIECGRGDNLVLLLCLNGIIIDHGGINV